MAGLQPSEGRMMIDLVVWAQYINVRDTQTHIQPLRQLSRHSNSCPNALLQEAKMMQKVVFCRSKFLTCLKFL